MWHVDANDSSRRNLGADPPGVKRAAEIHPLDEGNAVVLRCLARMRERQARYDREQAMHDDGF